MTHYVVYDVFTTQPFGGNQLAVIPDAAAILETDLQKIAREFNFSETTFVYPPSDPAHTAKVRIFTPTMEVAFAGHPTIGTAIALRDRGHTGDMVLELGVGPIPCRFDGDTASFTTSAPLERISEPETALVAAALGLPATAITSATHSPIQCSLGLTFVIAELSDRESLAACAPSIDAIRKGAAKYPAGLDFAIYAYVRDGNEIDSRMFAPLDDIPEDPATGSAAATLAALLTEQTQAPQQLSITQGEDMGRPSFITATTLLKTPVPVTISGSAVRTMEGQLVY
ncbi:trans-2,3-dihydro-3-hydroxyanthranilate isomerase [Yoonia maritima]|uniref:Trans-2,3-dihydro-3-hydroxyanthranilate isomerase n=1 Tax=Yoonia maritima TaxID=1435347 RepID=A0A2T0W1H5_9RHOB|nr:PhzF family phenazine biosynthesis protein [Yoonia maritima]PRY78793.1 trans-2,3-dihydro-3-hydroxyanthranilate isomerase [Yoonia maritima]